MDSTGKVGEGMAGEYGERTSNQRAVGLLVSTYLLRSLATSEAALTSTNNFILEPLSQ